MAHPKNIPRHAHVEFQITTLTTLSIYSKYFATNPQMAINILFPRQK